MPAEKKDGKGDEPVNLAVLRGKTVNGKVAIGSLTALRVKAENVKAEIKLADGKLEISPHSASLYGGTIGGVISADANGNRVHVKEDIKGVAVGPLLRDYARKDLLDGRGDISFDVNAAGATTLAIKRALAGSARIQMKEGSIKGINLNDPHAQRDVGGLDQDHQARPFPEDRFLGPERDIRDQERRRTQ